MHRIDNSKYLLYIEPRKEYKAGQPVQDEITETMKLALEKSKAGSADYSDETSNGKFREGCGWRGFHRSQCGEMGGSRDYLLENGMITNSLATFYLEHYRHTLPDSEVDKVNEVMEHYGVLSRLTYNENLKVDMFVIPRSEMSVQEQMVDNLSQAIAADIDAEVLAKMKKQVKSTIKEEFINQANRFLKD